MVKFTAVGFDHESENKQKKMPLNELIRSAAGRQESARSAQLTLDKIRANLINSDTVDEFESASQREGIFGWLRRRRRAATASSRASHSLAISPVQEAFATSQG